MGVNVGLQKFHFPRRDTTPPFPGLVGFIVPDLDIIRLRLTRLNKLQKFKDTPYKANFENNTAKIISSFGFCIRLHSSKNIPFLRPLINRWPIIQEPFSDQAEVMLDLERELGFMPGGKIS